MISNEGLSVVTSWASCINDLLPSTTGPHYMNISGDQGIIVAMMDSHKDIRIPILEWIKKLPIIPENRFDTSTMQQLANEEDSPGVIPSPNVTKECTSSEVGRYVVATEKIALGAPIIREQAFAFVPIHNSEGSHSFPKGCAYCGRTNMPKNGTVQCARCQVVQYCSVPCRKCDERLHRYECAGHRMGLWDLGVTHLAVRCFVTGVCDADELLKTYSTAFDLDEWIARVTSSTTCRYEEVLRLEANCKDTAVHVNFALTATMLTEYFRNYTTLFNLRWLKALGKNRAEIFVGSLLLRHLGQMVNNAHSVYGFRVRPHVGIVPNGQLHRFVNMDIVGAAIFPKIALLNHSCEPNIRNRYDGDALIIHATRPILAGEEVFNCYRPQHDLRDDEELGGFQQQYGFICSCPKCRKQPASAKNDQVYLCPNPECGAPIVPNEFNRFWWYKSDEDFNSIRCDNCETLVDTKWYHVLRKNMLSIVDSCKLYQCATKTMAKVHAQKSDACEILLSKLPSHATDSEANYMLLSVSEDLMNARSEEFGKLSLEYVSACVYWLDLISVLRRSAYIFDDAFGLKLKLDNISEIVEVTVASDIRLIFQRYIQQLR